MRFLPTSSSRKLVVLTPGKQACVPEFGRPDTNPSRYFSLLGAMQRLRGRVYLEDGAITDRDLLADGRHWQPQDFQSWHVLALDARGDVVGCARYRTYDRNARFQELGVARAEIANSDVWGGKLASAVRATMERARERQVDFVEVGGWALSSEVRNGADAVRIALSMFGLAELLGGSIGLTTATVRHCSATILRKIGGRPLAVGAQELPRYYDTRYQCDMEILQFDSSTPSERFRPLIGEIMADLARVDVFAPVGPAMPVHEPGVLQPAFAFAQL